MNNKIKIEVLKIMVEASSSSGERYEIRKQLEVLHDEEIRESERKQILILGLILLYLVGILISLDLNFWKPRTQLPSRAATSHVMDKTWWEMISSKPVAKPIRGHSQ